MVFDMRYVTHNHVLPQEREKKKGINSLKSIFLEKNNNLTVPAEKNPANPVNLQLFCI